MVEIIEISAPWVYDPAKCDTCEHLEHSTPLDDPGCMIACDGPNGACVIDGTVIYPSLHQRYLDERKAEENG